MEAKNRDQEVQINLTGGTFIPMVLKLECATRITSFIKTQIIKPQFKI